MANDFVILLAKMLFNSKLISNFAHEFEIIHTSYKEVVMQITKYKLTKLCFKQNQSFHLTGRLSTHLRQTAEQPIPCSIPMVQA